MNSKFGVAWFDDVSPENGFYSLRVDKKKAKVDNGEVAVSLKSVKFVGGVEGCAKRIVAVWMAMPEFYKRVGWTWYATGNEFAEALGKTYGYSTWDIAQVISILSPQNPWDGKVSKAGKRIQDGNRLCTVKVVKAYCEGGEQAVLDLRGWGYGQTFTRKALRVLRGETIDWSTSPKTGDFAMLLANPTLDDIAVVDTHASRIATGNLGGKYHVVGKAAYKPLADAYRLAAKILGVPVYVVQAGTWQFAVDGHVY